MGVQIIRERATSVQITEMLEALGLYIKLAVDVEREILAGGGEWHADCEEQLLADGSQQVSIWGADWVPRTQSIQYESLINIRPRQGNRTMEIQDPGLRHRIAVIIQNLLGGV